MEPRIRFAESPRSPFRRVKSRRSPSPMEQPVIISRKCERVGCLSAVNQQLSEEGLLRVVPLNPLVAEVHAPPQTSRSSSYQASRLKQKELLEVAEEEVKEAALVELAVFPGYNPLSATPLPHRQDSHKLMKIVIKAQAHLQCKPRFLKFFEEMFLSEESQEILKDMFWWYFLHRYEENQAVKDHFFSRISDNYIKLLIYDANQRWKDRYFELYPDVLAQSVYSAFIRAYPASWNSFYDSSFRTELCNIVHLWFTGTKPFLEHWRKWDFHALEPAGLMKVTGGKNESSDTPHKATSSVQLLRNASQSNTCSPSKGSSATTLHSSYPETRLKAEQTKKDLGVILDSCSEFGDEECEDKLPGEKLTRARFKKMPWMKYSGRRSVLPLEAMEEPEFEHCVFDAFGASPLVLHFLERQQLAGTGGYSCLLQRTEISHVPPQDSATYRSMINQSRTRSSETSAEFMRYYTTVMQQIHQFNLKQREAEVQHQHEVRMLLSNHNERKGLSSTITFNVLSDNPVQVRKMNVAKAIRESLQRISSSTQK